MDCLAGNTADQLAGNLSRRLRQPSRQAFYRRLFFGSGRLARLVDDRRRLNFGLVEEALSLLGGLTSRVVEGGGGVATGGLGLLRQLRAFVLGLLLAPLGVLDRRVDLLLAPLHHFKHRAVEEAGQDCEQDQEIDDLENESGNVEAQHAPDLRAALCW